MVLQRVYLSLVAARPPPPQPPWRGTPWPASRYQHPGHAYTWAKYKMATAPVSLLGRPREEPGPFFESCNPLPRQPPPGRGATACLPAVLGQGGKPSANLCFGRIGCLSGSRLAPCAITCIAEFLPCNSAVARPITSLLGKHTTLTPHHPADWLFSCAPSSAPNSDGHRSFKLDGACTARAALCAEPLTPTHSLSAEFALGLELPQEQ